MTAHVNEHGDGLSTSRTLTTYDPDRSGRASEITIERDNLDGTVLLMVTVEDHKTKLESTDESEGPIGFRFVGSMTVDLGVMLNAEDAARLRELLDEVLAGRVDELQARADAAYAGDRAQDINEGRGDD